MKKKKSQKKVEKLMEPAAETSELDFLAEGEEALEDKLAQEAEELIAAADHALEDDVVIDSEDSEETESPEAFEEVESGSEMDAGAETETESDEMDMAGTELEDFEAAAIEDVEYIGDTQILSVVESVLFSTDKPVSLAFIKQAFKGTQVKSKHIRDAIDTLQSDYADARRGFTLEEVAGGYQLRTKSDNMKYLRQSVKARPFKLSGPALEVLSIVAYKQPVTKAQIDEIRGVESGHLLRALMEKHIVSFGERSDLPGKPMFYETTRKFLEIFGLRNLQELPSIAEIDQLIPEGIGGGEEKETLSDLTGRLSQTAGSTYSEGEEELLKITDELSQISTSTDFFEQEKQRIKEQREKERAQDIRDALTVGETVDEKDVRWLERYDESLREKTVQADDVAFVTEGMGLGSSVGEGIAAEGFVNDDRATEATAEGPSALETASVATRMDALTFEEGSGEDSTVGGLADRAASALSAFEDDSEKSGEADA